MHNKSDAHYGFLLLYRFAKDLMQIHRNLYFCAAVWKSAILWCNLRDAGWAATHQTIAAQCIAVMHDNMLKESAFHRNKAGVSASFPREVCHIYCWIFAVNCNLRDV